MAKYCLTYLIIFCSLLQNPLEASSPKKFLALQKEVQQRLESHLDTFGKREKFSAIVMTIRQKYHAPVTVAAGFTDHNGRYPMSTDHLFQIGSIAKSFVAATIIKLASNSNDGFNLEDRLGKYFPEYPRWSSITVQELLTMTSGIPDFLQQADVLSLISQTPYHYRNPDSWLAKIHARPLQFTPGKGFHYSNSNYFLLGRLIEKITGKSLDQALSEHILTPLRLKKTFMVPHQWHSNPNLFLVKGYQNEKALNEFIPRGTEVSEYSLSYLFAAGNMIASTEDVSAWLEKLFTPGSFLSKKELHALTQLVSEKTGSPLPEVSLQNPYGYGLGILVHYSPSLKAPIYLYEGMTLGYRTVYVYVPQKQLIIVVAVNSSYQGKENHLIALINQTASLILRS